MNGQSGLKRIYFLFKNSQKNMFLIVCPQVFALAPFRNSMCMKLVKEKEGNRHRIIMNGDFFSG